MDEHGGLLIAALINLPPIFDDLYFEHYPFTVACAIVSDGYLIFYVVVYQPQSTSVYHIPINVLIESVTAYHSAFVSFCVKHDLNSIFDLYVIGEFNMLQLNWTTLLSPNSRDNEVLTDLADLGLNQVIDVANHKDGTIIDLNFRNYPKFRKPILHSIPKSFFRSFSCGFTDTKLHIQRAYNM